MQEYMGLTVRLYNLVNEGKGSSREANRLRDLMEAIYNDMTEGEKKEANILSDRMWEQMK